MGSLLRPNQVWNTAILIAGDDPFDLADAREIALFNNRRLRLEAHAVHTRADPFLFVERDQLYLFVEEQRVGQAGHISAFRTRDLTHFEPLGQILHLPHHASYPQVFRGEGAIHLLPETNLSGEVSLFTFDAFPGGLRKSATLLRGNYDDPTIVEHAGHWWLFVSSSVGLELYFSKALSGPYQRHPAGVIETHRARTRCGGAIINRGGQLYRPTQDYLTPSNCNLALMRIDELSTANYRETLAETIDFQRDRRWCELGGHHLSIAAFRGEMVIAVDGRSNDYWWNRPISMVLRSVPRHRQPGPLDSDRRAGDHAPGTRPAPTV